MWDALAAIGIASLFGYTGYVLGYRMAYRRSATWLVRPHTDDTLARVQPTDDGEATPLRVAEGIWVPTNLPGGGSRMER